VEFNVLPFIDTASNLAKLGRIDIRLPHMSKISSCNAGIVNTLDQYVPYMTREVNL